MNSQEKSQSQFTQDYEGSILNLLNSDNYRQYNVVIAKALGSVNAAIMLTELVQRQKYHENRDELIESPKTEGKWFYYTQDTAEDRLGLSRREQDDALKKLEVEGLIKKVILGVPGKRHFQINVNKIIEITKYSKKHSRLAETAKLDCTKTPNCFGGNVQSIYKEEIKDKEYKNLPPQSSKTKAIESIRNAGKDDDEFLSLLSFLNFSENQLNTLHEYSLDQLRHALEIFKTQKVKKSKIALLLNILNNPQNWEIPVEEQYTQNQLLALKHNEFLKKYLKPEIYEKNKETISSEKYFIVGYFYMDKKKIAEKLSVNDSKTEKQLLEDINESIRKWKKI